MSTTRGQQDVIAPPDLRPWGAAAAVVLVLPLAVAWACSVLVGPAVTGRRWYWARSPWWSAAAVVGTVVAGGVLVAQYVALAGWVRAGGPGELVAGDVSVLGTNLLAAVGTVWPWVVANVLAGVLLTPVPWLWRRRRMAKLVATRQMPSVVEQETAVRARAQAADLWAARQIGVRVDAVTGEVGPRRGGPRLSAPHLTGTGRARQAAFGLVARPTVRTWTERRVDTRRVPGWVDDSGRWVVLPSSAGAVRGLVLAESGSGKTVLLSDLTLCAVTSGWPVVVIDAKGAPADAAALAGQVRALDLPGGRRATAHVAHGWDMFVGTRAQVTSKIMRVLPPADGANQHYLDETRLVLDAVQESSPARSVADLLARIDSPTPWVTDASLAAKITRTDRAGVSMADRVGSSLLAALRPLEPHLSADGWSYDRRPADVTIVSLSPADAAQAVLGDLILADLRRFMDDRLSAGDVSPALVVVDEFAQLVTDGSDPAGVAASLFETARSAGLGLVLAAQSVAGLSREEAYRERVMASGAALFIGRSKSPEQAVKAAGTEMRLEASGAAAGDELRSGRAQHAWVISPQAVREAYAGAFWLVQAGAVAPFRALPPTQPAPLDVAADYVEEGSRTDEAGETALVMPAVGVHDSPELTQPAGTESSVGSEPSAAAVPQRGFSVAPRATGHG